MITDFHPDVVLFSVSIFAFEDTIKRIDSKLMEGRLVVKETKQTNKKAFFINI